MLKIREIEEIDNSRIEYIIKTCLDEYNAPHVGTAYSDPNIGRFSYIYKGDGYKYWVCVNEEDVVMGGVGIGPIVGEYCELQKMYLLKEARGSGIAYELINIALDYAKKFYNYCYLETLDNMTRAMKFYENNGFSRTDTKIGDTGHYNCDIKYIKEL